MLLQWKVIVAAIILTAVTDTEGLTDNRTNLKSLPSKAGDVIKEAQQDSSPRDIQFPKDCSELLLSGQNKSGVYNVWPISRAVPEGGAVTVYCDMTTDGGGWTVIQRRGSYGRPQDYFFKNWKSYKEGFGNLMMDFWLGNDYIYALTNQRKYSLRCDLWKVEGEQKYALYDDFWIGSEADNYIVHVDGYTGTAGDSFSDYHNGMMFSTYDLDHDKKGDENCAQLYKGAWWYNGCLNSNLNGLYLYGKHSSYADGIEWKTWTGLYYSLSRTEMKIRPVNFNPTKREA